ncbi:ATP-binding cassette domain-containing protein [soil metagenome]
MSELVIRYPIVRRGSRAILEAGEIRAACPSAIAVVGINGSGKSSLFMHLAGALRGATRAPAGIEVDGRRPSLAYVPQSPSLPPWLTAREAALLYGLAFDELCADMPSLHLVELEGQRCGRLSLGQQQVLAIALALSRDAELTMLDEPFSALDFRRRIGALELLHERVNGPRAAAILISSQSAADLASLCGHYVVLRDGHIVFNGPAASLTQHGAAEVEGRLLELLS